MEENSTLNECGFGTSKWSDDDDWHPITPFFGRIR